MGSLEHSNGKLAKILMAPSALSAAEGSEDGLMPWALNPC